MTEDRNRPRDTPAYVQRVLELIEGEPLEPTVESARLGGPHDPALVCVMRDERRRLESFIAHHRALGVRDFVFIDNGSADGSWQWLMAQDGVTLYRPDGRFTQERKQSWLCQAILRHEHAGWFLVLDADERLVFDGSDTRPLSDLVRLAESRGIHRVRGMLVDLYPAGPLVAPGVQGRRHELFDATGYQERLRPRMVSRIGGPRQRAFRVEGEPLSPELSKYPLFRALPGHLMANPHHHYPYEDNFASPCLLGLLHEKFRFDFVPRYERAVRERQYWNDSVEYRAYAEALARQPELSLEYEGSRRYTGPDDLLEAGLVEPLDWPD